MRSWFAFAAVAAAISLGGCVYDPGYGYYGGGYGGGYYGAPAYSGGYYGAPAYSGGVVAFGTTYGGWQGDRRWHRDGWQRGGWHRGGWNGGRQWQDSGWQGHHDRDG